MHTSAAFEFPADINVNITQAKSVVQTVPKGVQKRITWCGRDCPDGTISLKESIWYLTKDRLQTGKVKIEVLVIEEGWYLDIKCENNHPCQHV